MSSAKKRNTNGMAWIVSDALDMLNKNSQQKLTSILQTDYLYRMGLLKNINNVTNN